MNEEELRKIVFDWRWVYHKGLTDLSQLTTGNCVACGRKIETAYHCFRAAMHVKIKEHVHVHTECFPESLLSAMALSGREPENVFT